jgi:pimeloyl-ACP methyl ester carboxylesterase
MTSFAMCSSSGDAFELPRWRRFAEVTNGERRNRRSPAAHTPEMTTESWFERELLTLADGRALEVYRSGAPEGTPIVFHEGSPSAGTPFRPFADLAADRGVPLLTFSRPGYAASSRNPGRNIAAVASDVTAILDHIGADRCYTMGWSGGGPHALATAALLPDRVIAAASIAGVAPYPSDGLDWTAGMGAENVQEFGAAIAGPVELEAFLEAEGAWMAHVTAEQLVAGLGDLVSAVDATSVTGAYGDWLAAEFRAAVSAGIWGWFDDDMAFVHPWGFEISSISRPVAIWQGVEDRMVPFTHAEWLASHVGSARPHLLQDHGHLSLAVGAIDEIIDDLLASGA